MVSSRRVKNEIYAYNQYLNCGEHSFLSLLQCSIYVMKRKLRQWWPKFTSILTERTTNFYLNHGTLMKIQILVWEKSKGYCFALGYYYVYLLVQLSLFENNCEYTNSTIHFFSSSVRVRVRRTSVRLFVLNFPHFRHLLQNHYISSHKTYYRRSVVCFAIRNSTWPPWPLSVRDILD